MNFTWLAIFAKFIFTICVPPFEMFLVLQDPSLKPFKKKKKSKPISHAQ